MVGRDITFASSLSQNRILYLCILLSKMYSKGFKPSTQIGQTITDWNLK